MYPLSVLDLSPITEGSDAGQSFRNTLDLAQNAERLGYQRYWLAEHHGMPGIASAATSILIGHVAGGTQRIRVGAGGIMLPNHSPLVIAEQFGTLEALYPGRIDLGLGRAPGSDPATAHALRRNLASDADEFPRDVVELMDYMADEPRQRVRAVPGRGAKVPVWILGSSLFGAQLAAMLGLLRDKALHIFFELRIADLVCISFHSADKKPLAFGKKQAEADEIGAAKDIVLSGIGIRRFKAKIVKIPLRRADFRWGDRLMPRRGILLIQKTQKVHIASK